MRALILMAMLGACGPNDGAGDDECYALPAPGTGDGTYYNADGTGNCGFDASPDDLMIAAMNAVDYAYGPAFWCGACVRVEGPMGAVTVRIVDQCPGCAKGDLDLSPEAFALLSPLSAGRIPITWSEVACDVSGPIEYHFKDGANPYWTAIQIRNHRYPISMVEAKDGGGTYHQIERVDYNYFVQPDGLGPGPYTLRVTDARDQVLVDQGVELGDNITRAGAAQFPACE